MAGNLGTIEYMSSLENEMEQLVVKHQIKILGPVENVSELLSTANLGVLCSESEGLPVSLLEYGLAGLPVLCTQVGQCATVLGNGNWGWLVPPKNPQALADSIIEILSNKNLAAAKAQKFHEHILNEYGPNKFWKQYNSLLKTIAQA
jgi:glycosyltransferase involved in cell wall biosynthesis